MQPALDDLITCTRALPSTLLCIALQAHQLATLPPSADIPKAPPSPDLPDVLGQRKRAPAFLCGPGADTSLADLVGLLPDEELVQAQCEVAIQQLLQLPRLSFITDMPRLKEPRGSCPFGMYT